MNKVRPVGNQHSQLSLRNPLLDFARTVNRWIAPIVDLPRLFSAWRYPLFWRDAFRYFRMDGSEPLRLLDLHPCISDRTSATSFDPHYFYQHIWAFRHLAAESPKWHLDIGSRTDFVSLLSTLMNVLFVDIRPLRVQVDGLFPLGGSILNLPFADNSVSSISSLHVVEHIGLGRYGDPLDPLGSRKAAAELSRILAPGGRLYFSVPVGKKRVCFNGHRIFHPQEVLDIFPNCVLSEFSCVNDQKEFLQDVVPSAADEFRYGCGFFLFQKK